MNKKIYMKSYLLILILAITVASCGSTGNGGSKTSEDDYTVEGTLSGLGNGKTIVLQNNWVDDLSLTADGSFTFATKIANAAAAAYNVTVKTQPSGQSCTVSNETGTVSSANITNVAVTCSTAEITFPEPVATEVGNSVGSASSKTIGASGGELSSPDSSLSVSIPAGALANDTVISIQPITNMAHGGIGNGYLLTPDDTTFQQPVSLAFTYTDQDLAGTVPEALGIAFQTAEGYWQLADNVTVDTEAKTITTTTTHFSRWSFVEQFRLNPSEATVKVNDALLLQVEFCYELRGERNPKTYERPVLGFKCGPFSVSIASLILSDWSVNGIPGGNSTFGTVHADVDIGGYTAPSTKPDPNIVTVSVKVRNYLNEDSKVLLVSTITIIDEKTYTGTLKFNLKTGVSGTANVTWNMFEDMGDVRRYLQSGTIEADIDMEDCDHQHVTVPIRTSTPAQPEATLVVYTSTNQAYPKQYQFALTGDGNITLSCGSPKRVPVIVSANSIINVYSGSCYDNNSIIMASYTDENVLSEDSWSCSNYGLLSSSWEFKSQ